MPDLTQQTPPGGFADRLHDDVDAALPEGWWNWPNAVEAHKLLSRSFLSGLPSYPEDQFDGRGVVICAGGSRLFTNGWVCLRILRHVGCNLPVEFWHLPDEIDSYMAGLVHPYGVDCIDAGEVAERCNRRPRILAGWELKPFAILHSRFREVLLLDADNVALVDPEFLFDTGQFRSTGTIFWPDFSRMEPSRAMWDASEVPYRDEPEVESGQIVLDKARCWAALNLAMHYNEHSDFYYKHIHGDKCTFQFAWHRTQTDYAMPERGIHALDSTMCQHDFDGRRIFQHRNMDKWRLDGSNHRIEDFQLEGACRRFIAELRSRWNGRPFQTNSNGDFESRASAHLAGKRVWYDRVGYDSRVLELLPDGSIGEGAAECERYWSLRQVNGSQVLSILGDDLPTCHLLRDGDLWRGKWLRYERMQVELTVLGAVEIEPPLRIRDGNGSVLDLGLRAKRIQSLEAS